MKLSVVAALVAGAGIAQVAATPIRIIIGSPPQEGVSPLDGARFGHPVPLATPVATWTTWKAPGTEDRHDGPPWPVVRRPCHGRMSRIRQKGIEISNSFRKALGLPLIEAETHRVTKGGELHAVGGFVHVMSRPPKEIHPPQGTAYQVLRPLHDGGSPHRHHHHHGHRGRNGSFAARLNHSLMNLGRWEGRAVAFVLGCGIGVLLRMFWVLAIVTYRIIKGRRDDQHEYTHITVIEQYDETSVLTPPPTYIYPVDEKVALKEEEAPKTPTTTEESK